MVKQIDLHNTKNRKETYWNVRDAVLIDFAIDAICQGWVQDQDIVGKHYPTMSSVDGLGKDETNENLAVER